MDNTTDNTKRPRSTTGGVVSISALPKGSHTLLMSFKGRPVDQQDLVIMNALAACADRGSVPGDLIVSASERNISFAIKQVVPAQAADRNIYIEE